MQQGMQMPRGEKLSALDEAIASAEPAAGDVPVSPSVVCGVCGTEVDNVTGEPMEAMVDDVEGDVEAV